MGGITATANGRRAARRGGGAAPEPRAVHLLQPRRGSRGRSGSGGAASPGSAGRGHGGERGCRTSPSTGVVPVFLQAADNWTPSRCLHAAVLSPQSAACVLLVVPALTEQGMAPNAISRSACCPYAGPYALLGCASFPPCLTWLTWRDTALKAVFSPVSA